MKKIIATILAFSIIIGLFGIPSFANTGTTVIFKADCGNAFIDKALMQIDPDFLIKPYVENNQLMVPLRFYCGSIGAKVKWNADENEIKIENNGLNVSLKAGQKTFDINGKTLVTNYSAQLKDGSTYVPAEFISEAFGKNIERTDNGLFIISSGKTSYTADELSVMNERIENTLLFSLSKNSKDSVSKAEKLISEFSDDEWLKCVPIQSSRRRVESPANPEVKELNWIWDPKNPDQIKDPVSNMVFPVDNEEYKILYKEVSVISGKKIKVPYYKMSNGKFALIDARINFAKRDFIRNSILTLSEAYCLTGNEKYAERIIIALDKWADYVPDYYMTGKNTNVGYGWNSNNPVSVEEARQFNFAVERSSEENGPYVEFREHEIYAFNRVCTSPSMKRLSEEKGYDVYNHIRDDLFFNVADFTCKYQKPVLHAQSNLPRPMSHLGQVALMFRRNDYVEYISEYLKECEKRNITRDNFYPEAFTYHDGFMGGNVGVAMNLIKYYNLYPETESDKEEEIKNKALYMYNFYRQCQKSSWQVYYPDGYVAPFGDSTGWDKNAPRDKTESKILPVFGHIMLGTGEKDKQTQFNIHFADKANHTHKDTLSFTFYSGGKDLIGDIGYFHGGGRYYTTDSIAHNTVTVKGTKPTDFKNVNQEYGSRGHYFEGGSVVMYVPMHRGISISEIDGKNAYHNQVSRYHRLNILNTRDIDHPYVVDVFRVTGGTEQEYYIHGSTLYEQIGRSSFPLQKIDKKYPLLENQDDWREPINIGAVTNWYGSFRDMGKGTSPGEWYVSFMNKEKTDGVRIFMVDDKKSVVHLGKSPSSSDKKGFYGGMRPCLMVKNTSEDGTELDKTYIGVFEALNGKSVIESVKTKPCINANNEQVIIEITFTDKTQDTYVINMNCPEVNGVKTGVTESEYKNISLDGRIGMNLTRGEQDMLMFGAKRFEFENRSIENEEFYDGVCIDSKPEDNAIITKAIIPEGETLKGKYISLQFESTMLNPSEAGGYPFGEKEEKGISQMYEIDRIETKGGKTYIYTVDKLSLDISENGAVELMRPHRKFAGKTHFKIYNY